MEYHINPPLDGEGAPERGNEYGVSGTPTVFFNGLDRKVGSSPPPYSGYREVIERRAADSAAVAVDIKEASQIDGMQLSLRVDLEVVGEEDPAPESELYVQALIYEDQVLSRGEFFDHVVRSILLREPAGVAHPGESRSITRTFILDPAWKPEDLTVVVWVQDGLTGEVQNAALRKVADPTPVRIESWGAIKNRFVE